MATVKAVLRPRKDKDGNQTVYIRIADAGKTRYITTGLKLKKKFWNAKKQEVRVNDYIDASHLNKIIADKLKSIRDEAYELEASDQSVNADVLKQRAMATDYRGDFLLFARKFTERKAKSNIRTGKKYTSTVNKISEFAGGRLPFRELTVPWLKEFADWCATEHGNGHNTIHSNLRSIRAILYDAIREDLFPQEKNPFFKFKLTQPKVTREKLNTTEIKALATVEPNGNRVQHLAKDMFLFSFFTFGMRFRDVAMLKWHNIEGDTIRYQMHKTKDQRSVPIYPPAMAILDKYRRGLKPDDFIFPLLDTRKDLSNPAVLDADVSSKNAYINKELKKLREKAGISKHFSFHTARHSYADIARDKGGNLYDISERLGHTSLKTTERYLKALGNDTNHKDEAAYEGF